MGKALGKDFNVMPVATGVHIDLSNAQGVTFVLYENGGDQQIVFKESVAGASEQALATVNELYACSGVTAGVWTRDAVHDAGPVAMDNESTVQKQDDTAHDCAAIYIGADELSAGFDSVECTIDGAGLCIAIVHGLNVQRQPENLATVGV
jgi:hypothetical protein